MKNHRIVLAIIAFTIVPVLAVTRLCTAHNHEVQLDEVMAGCGGDRSIQFVEMLFSHDQNRWGGCAELAFFDAQGKEKAVYPFRHNVPDDHLVDGNSALIATRAFANLPGAPKPDFIIEPSVISPGGSVCFRNTNGKCFPVNLCLSYGDFGGDTADAGPPAPALPTVGAHSLQRFQNFEDNGHQDNEDFLRTVPAPRNNHEVAGTVVASAAGCHVEPLPIPVCGNGVVEPGEECDSGGVTTACCSASCRAELKGTPCPSDDDLCTTDTCDGFGMCAHDGCTGCLTCDSNVGCVAAPAPGCAVAVSAGASLKVTNVPDDNQDRVVWQWKGAAPVPTDDFGDPRRAGGDYDFCIYETGVEPAIRLESRAPAGGTCAGVKCWKKTRAGFGYRDGKLTPDGLLSIALKGSVLPGKSTIAVRGKGPLLDAPLLPLRAPVTVQLRRSDGGACWEAKYRAINHSPTEDTATSN